MRYKDHVQRGKFGTLHADDIAFFREKLGINRVLTDPTDVDGYNVDWLRIVRGLHFPFSLVLLDFFNVEPCQLIDWIGKFLNTGSGKLVLKPKTTEEISAIMQHCWERNLAVCLQGGNTGLVGGSVPVYDEVILSTSLMDSITSFDEWSGMLFAPKFRSKQIV